MKRRLWVNLFIKLAIIFVAFVFILEIANSTLLLKYFTFKQEHLLAEKSLVISKIDYKNTGMLDSAVSELKDKYSFETDIYDKNTGHIVYST